MISLFERSSPRGFNLKLNVNLIQDVKKAEALGMWVYIRSYNDDSTIDTQRLIIHFDMTEQNYNEAIDYLLEKRIIKVDKDKKTITALATPEIKEYTIDANPIQKPFKSQPISER